MIADNIGQNNVFVKFVKSIHYTWPSPTSFRDLLVLSDKLLDGPSFLKIWFFLVDSETKKLIIFSYLCT